MSQRKQILLKLAGQSSWQMEEQVQRAGDWKRLATPPQQESPSVAKHLLFIQRKNLKVMVYVFQDQKNKLFNVLCSFGEEKCLFSKILVVANQVIHD